MSEPNPHPAEAENRHRRSSQPLLAVEGLCKYFGGVRAADGVSFSVAAGQVMGLIGPNGAGKTTLFNMISGALSPDSGVVRFDGEEVQDVPAHRRVALGISRTFQNVELFHRMSVLENVLVGQHVQTRCGFWGAVVRSPKVRKEEVAARLRAMELLEFVGLSGQADSRSSDLPFGWQRLLEIARALASRPRILLLDEPAAGLNPSETFALGGLIHRIRSSGVTVLMVEHDMSLTMEISDRIVVLDRGLKLAEGTPREIQMDAAVLEAYLGGGTPGKSHSPPASG
ncbi:MAG: ABC transporter ATP-binding protein [Desulfobacterales bacterium]